MGNLILSDKLLLLNNSFAYCQHGQSNDRSVKDITEKLSVMYVHYIDATP